MASVSEGLARVRRRGGALGPTELELAPFHGPPGRGDARPAPPTPPRSTFTTRPRGPSESVAQIWREYLGRKWRKHMIPPMRQRRDRPAGTGAPLAIARPEPDRLLVCVPDDPSLADRPRDQRRHERGGSRRSTTPTLTRLPIVAIITAEPSHEAINGEGSSAGRLQYANGSLSVTSPAINQRHEHSFCAKTLRSPRTRAG